MTMDSAFIIGLYDYNRWANRRFTDAAQLLAAEMFTRHLGGSYPSLRGTLVHIFGAEWVWLERWNGRSHPALPGEADFPDIATLCQAWTELQQRQRDFLDGLNDARLLEFISYVNFKGQRWAHPLWQQMLHVVNHSSYHRGQATNMFRQMNAEPVATDLLLYYEER
jgi:uncharacterized damage-inducible protein DinB